MYIARYRDNFYQTLITELITHYYPWNFHASNHCFKQHHSIISFLDMRFDIKTLILNLTCRELIVILFPNVLLNSKCYI